MTGRQRRNIFKEINEYCNGLRTFIRDYSRYHTNIMQQRFLFEIIDFISLQDDDEYKTALETLDADGLIKYRDMVAGLVMQLWQRVSPNSNREASRLGVEVKKTVESVAVENNANTYHSSYKVPTGFYAQFNETEMIPYRAKSQNNTKCNLFLPDLVGKLGSDVKAAIFPTSTIGYQANQLKESFKSNPNLIQIIGDGTEDKEKAIDAAIKAQELADSGHLVIAALDDGGTEGHVAAIGPRSLTYATFPIENWKKPADEGYIPNVATTGGNPSDGEALVNFPVFVQAGSYTGVVPPGFAMSRPAIDANKVLYFLYKGEVKK